MKKMEIGVVLDLKEVGIDFIQYHLSGSIKSVIQSLQKLIDDAETLGYDPETLQIDVSAGYEPYTSDPEIKVSVSAFREETDEECAKRAADEKAATKRSKKFNALLASGMSRSEASEYMKFQELKAKFEKSRNFYHGSLIGLEHDTFTVVDASSNLVRDTNADMAK